jgi:hypothetical protein
MDTAGDHWPFSLLRCFSDGLCRRRSGNPERPTDYIADTFAQSLGNLSCGCIFGDRERRRY